MSHLPEEEAADLIERSCRTAFTEHTITGRAALLACLEEARADGYAVTDQEYYLGDISVAALVIDRTGRPPAGGELLTGYRGFRLIAHRVPRKIAERSGHDGRHAP